MLTTNDFSKSMHILVDSASGVQVDDIGQATF